MVDVGKVTGVGRGVLLSSDRKPAKLAALAVAVGPAEAVGFGDVVVIPVLWNVLPLALERDALTWAPGAVAGRVNEASFRSAARLGSRPLMVQPGGWKHRGAALTHSVR